MYRDDHDRASGANSVPLLWHMYHVGLTVEHNGTVGSS